MPRKVTKESFIEKAITIHGDKYNYSLVDYINCKIKVNIICQIHGVFDITPDSHINNKCGCPVCGRELGNLNRRHTGDEFIETSKIIHGDKYDYSLVEYKTCNDHVKIICPKHGVFEQTPLTHRLSGCPRCGSESSNDIRRRSVDEFIETSKIIHGDKYDYSLVKYVNCSTKVKIICPKHGVFEQTPNSHGKSGCKQCGREIIGDKNRSNTEEFIQKAISVHGYGKYDYSLVDYKNDHSKVKIICPKHGVFEQTPSNHIHVKKYGCKQCATELIASKRRSNTEEFIQKAIAVHGCEKYDYSLVNYKNHNTKVKIICPKHGVFEQSPNVHLNKCGCGICNKSTGEVMIRDFLIKHSIVFESEKRFSDCRHKNPLPFDFFLPEHNMCIEYDGEQHFRIDCQIPRRLSHAERQKKLESLQHRDRIKNEYCKTQGIRLLRIPYTDKHRIPEILAEAGIVAQESPRVAQDTQPRATIDILDFYEGIF